jgi:hypothetical protein
MKKTETVKGTRKRNDYGYSGGFVGHHAHADRQARQAQLAWTLAASRPWAACMHACSGASIQLASSPTSSILSIIHVLVSYKAERGLGKNYISLLFAKREHLGKIQEFPREKRDPRKRSGNVGY